MSQIATIALALMLTYAAPSATMSQQSPDTTNDTQSQMMGPGNMGARHMGPGRMMGGGMVMDDCPIMGLQNAVTPTDRLTAMKDRLAITDAQQNAWKDYTEKVTKVRESMGAMRDHMQKMQAAKSPVDRLDAHITAMEERLSMMKDVKPTLQALYDSFSADQKAKADNSLSPMGCMM